MRKYRSVLTATGMALIAVLAPAAAAAQPFEGVVSQRIVLVPPQGLAALAGDGQRPDAERVFATPVEQLRDGAFVLDMSVTARGPLRRVDVSLAGALIQMPSVYMILDGDAGSATMVMPDMRMQMPLPGNDLTSLLPLNLDQMGAALGTSGAETRQLGSTRLNGIDVVGYEFRGDDFIARGWTAPEYRDILDVPGLTPPAAAGDPTARLGEEGLPIRVQMLLHTPPELASQFGSGWMYLVLDVTGVERRAVDDGAFEIPADFQAVDPNLMPFPRDD